MPIAPVTSGFKRCFVFSAAEKPTKYIGGEPPPQPTKHGSISRFMEYLIKTLEIDVFLSWFLRTAQISFWGCFGLWTAQDPLALLMQPHFHLSLWARYVTSNSLIFSIQGCSGAAYTVCCSFFPHAFCDNNCTTFIIRPKLVSLETGIY